MTPIDMHVTRSKVGVEGQAYSLYVGEGGISVLQKSIFTLMCSNIELTAQSNWYQIAWDQKI